MTKSEKRYLNAVSQIGCVVDGCGSPGEIHHPRFSAGIGQRAPHWLGICLCPAHHRTGGHGVAIHAGLQTFESLYGTEEELLARTIERVFLND